LAKVKVTDKRVLKRKAKYIALKEEEKQQAIAADDIAQYQINVCFPALMDTFGHRKDIVDCITKGNRVSNSACRVKGWIKDSCFYFKGEGELGTWDMANAHPSILGALLAEEAFPRAAKEWVKVIRQGDIYDLIQSEASKIGWNRKRSFFKKVFCTWLNSDNAYDPRLATIMAKLAPTTTLAMKIIRKRHYHSYIANRLMQIEQMIMKDYYRTYLMPFLMKFMDESDGFKASLIYKEFIETTLTEHFKKWERKLLGNVVLKWKNKTKKACTSIKATPAVPTMLAVSIYKNTVSERQIEDEDFKDELAEELERIRRLREQTELDNQNMLSILSGSNGDV
jgi:hypothetical protein